MGLGVIISLQLFHIAYSQLDEIIEGQLLMEKQIEASAAYRSQKNTDHVVISNGIVNLTLTVPEGYVSSISYKGSDNLLSTQNHEDNRGYWDMTWTTEGSGDRKDKFVGTSYKILVQNEKQTEISFTRKWSNGSEDAPLNIDKRFVLMKDSPGFYTYTLVEHLEGWPAFRIQEARIVLKYQEKFNYMAVSDSRRRFMPTPEDRDEGRCQSLAFKEAVLLTNPLENDFKGEVDDKYHYSSENYKNKVHGWVGDGVGVWMITPSNEFRGGGPFKQDLTSHVGPTMLNMFTSTHYAGESLAVDIQSSENWKKVWGPVFVYLNSNSPEKENLSQLWDDAKERAQMEADHWPYAFPLSNDYLKSNQRGTLKGQILVNDWFRNKSAVPATSAYVGLARGGGLGSWQYENKGYQFWTQADDAGNFIIKNVIPGTYTLYASIPGIIGDFKYYLNITIKAGSQVQEKNIVFKALRNGPTLWEIGIPDRTAAEFFIPDSIYKVHKYPPPLEKFKEYGLWTKYTDLFPKDDLEFTVGKSDYERDWFFAQVNRQSGKQFEATVWKIVFELKHVNKQASYTLWLAVAGAHGAEIQVRINTPSSRPLFSTGLIGQENIIARSGIHGMYRLYSIVIPGNLLVDGVNTIFLRQTRALGPFQAVMYDYIRLEGPAA
ncbi:uncharacterized protein LOC127248504 [Andrographis paniculata]|uniref:uncharacterized protein LOC127248504 n=1 Tax=Andrographis paniculata TaxID=175694 RepID=UPI0021E808F0|nr:uncharacterized protein LOC127248504 [Andrographis paniculata]